MAENRLICVHGLLHLWQDPLPAKRASEMLMVTLRQAGLPVNMCKIGGAYLQDYIPVGGHGVCTLAWRLVTVNASSKEEMMKYFDLITVRLADFHVKVSNWTKSLVRGRWSLCDRSVIFD
jgi:hypothetical protein